MMQSETTTTTTHTSYETSSGPPPSSGISFNLDYLRSLQGIFKVAELVLSMLTFICTLVGAWGGGQGWVATVAISCFLTTVIYLIFFLINFIGKFQLVPWNIVTLIVFAIMTFCFLIAAIVAAANAHRRTSIVFATIFSIGATIIYAVDTFFYFRAWREGTTTTSTSNTTTTTTTTAATVEY